MIAIILGTRPEITKTAPVVFEAQCRGIPVAIIHTGQHYSPELDDIFFQELNVPKPRAHAHVGSHSAPKQIGLMLQRLADILEELKPRLALVQGDTNSVLAGALAAYKMQIPVAHLEAGLRSDDWSMPEEANRVLADRLSRWLFCPTELQRARLKQEGIEHAGIHVVGNTSADAALHFTRIAYDKSDVIERLRLTGERFSLLTMHRPSNVDEPERLRGLIAALHEAHARQALRIVFPVHPRTRRMLELARIVLPPAFVATEPLGYLDLLRLQASAELVLTDSGGIQEEACVLRVPAVTLRPNTERPETLDVGANVLFDETDADKLHAVMLAQMSKPRTWNNPFGDGTTARQVVDILTSA